MVFTARSVTLKPHGRPSERVLSPKAAPDYRVKNPVTTPPTPTLTLGVFVAHLETNGLTKFRTNEGGYGCQLWTSTVVASLTDAGYIEGGDYKEKCNTYLHDVKARMKFEGIVPNSPDEDGAFFGYQAEWCMPTSKKNAYAKYAQDCAVYDEQTQLERRIEMVRRDLRNAGRVAT